MLPAGLGVVEFAAFPKRLPVLVVLGVVVDVFVLPPLMDVAVSFLIFFFSWVRPKQPNPASKLQIR